MSDDVFDGHILAEKLFKLNSSQQSIESLSRLCVSHRKRAKQIVETWDKSFKSAQRDQRVSFLYLANDILQNSRRKGNEFVNEFWKVLPAALKHVYGNGDENGKKAASRLVDIWDERRVFGSRGQNLKDEMLGRVPLAQSVTKGKSSNPIKIVKRDANSLRIKLTVGSTPEKMMTAFQLLHDENLIEETALNNCEGAVRRVGDLERDVECVSTQGNLQDSALLDEIQEQEILLQQCVGQLESAEAARTSLASQLKEALQDQELKLEIIRTQLQAARGQLEQAVNMRQKLVAPSPPPGHSTSPNLPVEVATVFECSLPSVQVTSLPPVAQTVVPFAATKVTEEGNTKAAAAAVAAKLAASASSAQMLTSVLSSLVAEEAASISGGFKSAGFPTGLSMFPPEKRSKLEKPMPVSEVSNSEAGNSAYFTSMQQQPVTNVSIAPPTSMQPLSQSNQTQFPPPPPPPPGNSPANQFAQSAGLMMGMMPYVYAPSSLPPPPPLPSHIAMGLVRPTTQQPQSQQQQQTLNNGYYRPPGIGFYGQSHQPTPPPVPRQ